MDIPALIRIMENVLLFFQMHRAAILSFKTFTLNFSVCVFCRIILKNSSFIKYHRNTEWQNLLSAKTLIALPLLLLVHVPLLCRVL